MRFRDLKKQSKEPKKAQTAHVAYAGFLQRTKAFVTDIFMIGLPVALVIMIVFGYEETKSAGALDVIVQDAQALEHEPNPAASIVQIMLIMGVHVVLWRRDGQTPGKKFSNIKVVDAKTLEEASYPRLIVRFIAYFISFLSIIGFFLIFLRKDKRALHDLLSGTAVIYSQ
ncbi:RDD family protein [bacterium]|nr:RDD family protein [bacterium]MBU1989909.1 RDD family protein [bacterium]